MYMYEDFDALKSGHFQDHSYETSLIHLSIHLRWDTFLCPAIFLEEYLI